MERIKKNCLTCENEFSVRPCDQKRKYCGQPCYKIAWTKRNKKYWELRKAFKVQRKKRIYPARIKKQCLVCGIEFEIPKSLNNRKYCSKSCYVVIWTKENELRRIEKPTIYTPEMRKKISERQKLRGNSWVTEETRKKLSIATRGRKPNLGKKLSPEQREAKRIFFNSPRMKEINRQNRLKIVFPLKDSKPEVLMQNILQKNDIPFVKHKPIVDIQHSYQCDIFVPDLKLVIEVDGLYWHKYPDGLERDHIRTDEMREKGYKVLRFWEGQFDEEIVRNKICEVKVCST
jgi:very-short-patch-repair endonuclease